MFGFVTPFIPELKVKEHSFYKAVYCGLCRSMGQTVCEGSRLALSYDIVFLALVRFAVTGTSPDISASGCTAHPFKKRPVASDDHVLPYCAAAGALLTYYKIADDIRDEKGAAYAAKLALMPAAKHIRRKAALDELDKITAEKLTALAEAEHAAAPSADMPAEIFGEMLAEYFAYGLEGNMARIAFEIGLHTGRWIYLADAAYDMEKDAESGSYNPYLCGDESKYLLSGEKKLKSKKERAKLAKSIKKKYSESIRTALTMELKAIDSAIDLINYSDHGIENIIKNIVHLGLPSRADKILDEQ